MDRSAPAVYSGYLLGSVCIHVVVYIAIAVM